MDVTRSLYIIGGAGSGKSTFTASILSALGSEMGPLEDLHTTPNARGSLVTLRGHTLADGGLYLGCMRDEFPGTDGLDRASSITAEEWLAGGGAQAYPYLLGEGATLATRRFLYAAHAHTELLLIHLVVDPVVADIRFHLRGSSQDDRFVKNTVTRSENLWREMVSAGVASESIDISDALALDCVREQSIDWLRN